MPPGLIRAGVLTGAVALVALGCGGSSGPSKPKQPPPEVKGVRSAPPPAWIETRSGDYWLAFTDYCWSTTCVDFRPPPQRHDIPTIAVARGESVRFQLQFDPSRVGLILGSTTVALEKKRSPSWKVTRGGLVILETSGPGGRAKYMARLSIR